MSLWGRKLGLDISGATKTVHISFFMQPPRGPKGQGNAPVGATQGMHLYILPLFDTVLLQNYDCNVTIEKLLRLLQLLELL